MFKFFDREMNKKDLKWKQIPVWLMGLGILVSLYIGLFNSSKTPTIQYITDPSILQKAMKDGKPITLRGKSLSVEYEKNYQMKIDSMNH
jgi:hypothetical protein